MKISASELVKRSASQLLYKEIKRIQWRATPRQFEGNKYAEEIVKLEKASAEKRGIISLGEDLLFFCIDMVKDNKYIEIKMIEDEENYEDWYLYSSIMQSTFYASLLQQVKTLDTPKFRKKEGFIQEIIKIVPNPKFELWFGKHQRYRIFPNDKVLTHYLDKAKLISKCVKDADFDTCREFDAKYKFKEFSIFKPKYKKLDFITC
jgi:hypothetical protein